MEVHRKLWRLKAETRMNFLTIKENNTWQKIYPKIIAMVSMQIFQDSMQG